MSFVLTDFVQSVPSPVTFALVALAEPINALKNVLQILNWRTTSSFDGFLLIFAWWALCLFADSVLRYCLPIVFVASALYRRSRKLDKKQQVITEKVLAQTVSDLSVIPTLLPAIPPFPTVPLRAIAILYVPYLFLTCFIPLRLIFAIGGSVILSWRAPFAIILRRILWRSAFVRWSIYTAWAYISGTPLPQKSISPQTQTFQAVTETKDNDETPPQSSSLRFLFTICENQRWWMGLDWTAALLPGERPSWCSLTQAPLSPPGVFSLPEPSVVYLPHPTNATKKIKRTAEWYWEEPEWTVLVRKEGGPLSRVERPVPAITEEGPTANNAAATGSRLFKAASSRFAGKDKDHSKDDSSSVHSVEKEREVETRAEESTNEPFTDPDGWVFGDNKWENQSNKGGISKYTRFRRWTRVAVLTEFVSVVDASEESKAKSKVPQSNVRKAAPPAPINVSKDGAAPSYSSAIASPVASNTNATTAVGLDAPSPQATITRTQPTASSGMVASPTIPGPTSPAISDLQSPVSPPAESPLRQRLRNALSK